MALVYFLLHYNRKSGVLASCERIDDSHLAVDQFGRAERENDDADIEVVLLGSDSLESLKITHSHYFTELSGAEIMRELERV